MGTSRGGNRSTEGFEGMEATRAVKARRRSSERMGGLIRRYSGDLLIKRNVKYYSKIACGNL